MAVHQERVIEIHGNSARIKMITIEREVKTEDLLHEIAKSEPVSSDFLPHGTVLFSRRTSVRNETKQLYILERPAGLQTCSYRRYIRGEEGYSVADAAHNVAELKLSWPNQLWFVRTLGNRILGTLPYFTMQPVAEHGMETLLFNTLMPNVDTRTFMCVGRDFTADMSLPMHKRIDAMLLYILAGSTWNRDLMPDRAHYQAAGISTLMDWNLKSAADPEIWKKIKFPVACPDTVRAAIDTILEAD